MTMPLVPRIYRALLRVLPGDFRSRYGAEMAAMFAAEWQDTGWRRRILQLWRAMWGLLVSAIALRVTPEFVSSPLERRVDSGTFSGAAADLRVAWRGLARRPAFTATAAMTVALGIGATTAVFSVVDATVMRGLQGVPEVDRTVAFWSTFDRQAGQEFELSVAEFLDLRTDVSSLDLVGAWWWSQSLLEPRDGIEARTIDVALTSGDIYRIVGARTVLGRLPGEGDDRPGEAGVAVISHALWRTAFREDPGIVGSGTLRVNGQSIAIIGVLAPGVTLPRSDASAAWVHQVHEPASGASRSGHWLTALATLHAGTTVESARAELATMQQRWARQYAGQHSFGLDGHAIRVTPLSERVLGSARRVAFLLAVAAGLLLMLACANVANLLIARGETRTSEVGVRIALGASTRRVAQPVLLEGITLGAIGGVIGMALAAIGLPALLRLAPEDLVGGLDVRIDLRVALFAIVVSLLTGLLFTLAPAWKAARRAPSDLLRASGRGRTAGTRGLRLLVAGQTALATVILIGAALLARSLQQLNAVDPGLDTASRVAVSVTLPVDRYRAHDAILGFYDEVQSRVAGIPGVQDVSLVRNLPLRDGVRPENILRDGEVGQENMLGINVQVASTGALRTLGIPIMEGREFGVEDRATMPPVAVLNSSAARALWPGESAIGKRVRATFLPAEYGPITIVGVSGDVRSGGLSAVPRAELTLPLAQGAGLRGWVRNLTVVAHTTAAPEGIIASMRATIAGIDRNVAVERATTMQEVLHAGSSRERFLAVLLSVFSVLALAIAAVGVFGVVSFTVARQSRELAIRSALGARRTSLLQGVLRTYAVIAGAGAVTGAVAAAVAAPALGSFLYKVAPRDGVVLAGVPLVLVSVAILSSLWPTLRATRVSPARALD
jgi:putative ABC transport system permease protein